MPHHRTDSGQILGWGPTVQEIDALATLFSSIRHVAVIHEGPPPGMALPYGSDVELIPLKPTGGPRLLDKLRVLVAVPSYARAIRKNLKDIDVVHVRAPANVAFIALLMLTLRRKPKLCWIKYAGNWQPEGKEPLSYRIQRWLLLKGFTRSVVTVNGDWPRQPSHVKSFVNPSLTAAELRSIAAEMAPKRLLSPYQFLFVGRLDTSKGIWRAVQTVERLRLEGHELRLHVVGEGREEEPLRARLREGDLSGIVELHRALSRVELNGFYERAHFLLLPTASEGWPKVASEAMAYGVVPILGAVSSIPQILERTGAGLSIPPQDIAGFARAVSELIADPESWERLSEKGRTAAPMFTYEKYLDSVKELFAARWKVFL